MDNNQENKAKESIELSKANVDIIIKRLKKKRKMIENQKKVDWIRLSQFRFDI